MCDRCEEAAGVVAAQTEGAMDTEDVLRIVRAFNAAADALAEADVLRSGPEAEQITDGGEPDGFLEALVSGGLVSMVEMYPLGARPFVLIEAEEVSDDPNPDGTVNVAVTARTGGGLHHEAAISVIRTTLAQVEARSADA